MPINGPSFYRPSSYGYSSANRSLAASNSSSSGSNSPDNRQVDKKDEEIQILVDACYMKFMESLAKELKRRKS